MHFDRNGRVIPAQFGAKETRVALIERGEFAVGGKIVSRESMISFELKDKRSCSRVRWGMLGVVT